MEVTVKIKMDNMKTISLSFDTISNTKKEILECAINTIEQYIQELEE